MRMDEGEVDILVETGWRSDFKFSISAGSTSINTDALDGDNNFRVRIRALAPDGTVGNGPLTGCSHIKLLQLRRKLELLQ